jgi:acyl-CoA synthetase (AMP-forming)/AMP-acid ligase II
MSLQSPARTGAPVVPPATFELTVASLFAKQARLRPDAPALREDGRRWTYRELAGRVQHWVAVLADRGVRRGERVALLSENRHEYVELQLAAARIGAVVACLNWRLADEEMLHCIRLTEPVLLVVSPRYAGTAARLDHGVPRTLELGEQAESLLESQNGQDSQNGQRPELEPPHPEDGLVILYTSGTTGLPKGAVISQRAMQTRMLLMRVVIGARPEDTFIAWAPMFHMVSTDQALATLMIGGVVEIIDGLDLDAISEVLGRAQVGWLVAMPGMIDRMIEHLRGSSTGVRGVRVVGAMADLVPTAQLRELTALLGAPYLNTFGSTECGLAPATAHTLAPGRTPDSLSKHEAPYCDVRLVAPGDERDPDLADVGEETPGELLIRGPSVFSGYWNAEQTNREDFRGGWFHSGDMFVRHADGTLDFVDRVKYMIKTGGENVYPAEIERHLLAHPQVVEAAVVRRPDERWGEVPVAFVALTDGATTTPDELLGALRDRLSSYKLPKALHVIGEGEFPRSTTGKVQRHEVANRFPELLRPTT